MIYITVNKVISVSYTHLDVYKRQILRRNDKILICRRGPGGSCGYLWEFPGGKIEPGETGEDCAVRECREELGVEIQLQGLREETVYEYPDGLYGFVFYDGVIISGEPEKRVQMCIRDSLGTAHDKSSSKSTFFMGLLWNTS